MTGNDVLKFLSKLTFSKEETIENFEYAKLEDGTIISADIFEVGKEITKILEDGTKEVLTDGEYIISITVGEEDLMKKVVIKDGLIESIEDTEVETPEVEVSIEAETELESEVEVPETEVLEITPEMQVIMDKIVELESRISVLEGEKEVSNPQEQTEVAMETEKLEKLDGAPVEEFSRIQNKNLKTNNNSQNNFLSKLYR